MFWPLVFPWDIYLTDSGYRTGGPTESLLRHARPVQDAVIDSRHLLDRFWVPNRRPAEPLLRPALDVQDTVIGSRHLQAHRWPVCRRSFVVSRSY